MLVQPASPHDCVPHFNAALHVHKPIRCAYDICINPTFDTLEIPVIIKLIQIKRTDLIRPENQRLPLPLLDVAIQIRPLHDMVWIKKYCITQITKRAGLQTNESKIGKPLHPVFLSA